MNRETPTMVANSYMPKWVTKVEKRDNSISPFNFMGFLATMEHH